MPNHRKFHVVLVTCASLAEARKIARRVVAKRFAACVTIHTTPFESIYHWKGKVETAQEFLLILKTTSKRLKNLETEVTELHSYDTPEFLVLTVHGGSKKYLDWLAANT